MRSALIVGRRRVRLDHLTPSSEVGLIADVEELDQPHATGSADVDSLIDELHALVASLPPEQIGAEAADFARTTSDPRLLADVIGGNIRRLCPDPSGDFAIRQELLETTDPVTRLTRLRDLLSEH
jgi:hypothetical protein